MTQVNSKATVTMPSDWKTILGPDKPHAGVYYRLQADHGETRLQTRTGESGRWVTRHVFKDIAAFGKLTARAGLKHATYGRATVYARLLDLCLTDPAPRTKKPRK
jgi:hypothetical protein